MDSGKAVNVFGNIAVVNEDTGEYSKSLMDYLSTKYSLSIVDNDKELKDSDILVKINSDYSNSLKNGKKPLVEIKGADGDGVLISVVNDIEEFNNKKLKMNIIENYNSEFFSIKDIKSTENTNPMSFIMVCYFMLIGGSTISEDAVKLKQGNVLKRALENMIGIVYAVLAFLFVFLDLFKVGAGEIISKISMLFPFHWVQKAMNGGSAVVAVSMILLMAGVFFTAGGFRYKNFISSI